MRKPMQITAVPETENRFETLYVLCDDGTIWQMYHTMSGDCVWKQVPPIPSTRVETRDADDSVA